MLQRELHRRPGDSPQAGIIGCWRKQILAASHHRPQAGEGLRIVFQQTFHVETPDKSAHAPHEDGGHAEQDKQQKKRPANPRAGVAQDFLHGVPGQDGGIGGVNASESDFRFLEKRRERLDLCFRKRQKRAVHDLGMRDVQQRHNAENDNQARKPQENALIFPVVVGLVHGRISPLCNANTDNSSFRSRSILFLTRRI